MPSLRRTASSPSVRSSPYGYSSSFNGAVARGHGHRRSSGSETSSRRVLADIEWWRVTDGQCELGAGDMESEERTSDVVQYNVAAGGISGAAFFNFDNGADHPLSQSELSSSIDVSSGLPTAEFAALSLAPHTPLRRVRRGLESTSSSLESTPEPCELRFEGLRLGLSDMDMDVGLLEDFPSLSLSFSLNGSSIGTLTRAHTFADCLTLQQDEFGSCYPDSPMPSLLALPAFIN